MAKQFKIKRSRQYGSGSSYRAGPHPVLTVLAVLAVLALIFVGINIYQPFMDFITSDHSAGDVSMPESTPSSEAPAESLSESEPEPTPAAPTADKLRSVYLPIDTARDAAALQTFLDSLAGSEINAVMIDIKDATGKVLYNTTNEQAAAWGAPVENPLDLKAFAVTLQSRNLSLVVRISAFRDPVAARADNRQNAITYGQTNYLWLDIDENPWLNPYTEGARAYLTALAVEAADAGAKLVVLNDMHFPYGSATNANLGPDSATITRAQILSTFVEEISVRLAEKNARAAVYMGASSINSEAENATRYGGSPLDVKMETLMLGALPYQFSGDYNTGGLVIQQPLQNPAGVTQSVLAFIADAYTQRGEEAPAIIPLLQGGNEEANAAAPFTAEQVSAQIEAASATEIGGYVLYQTTGNYLLKAGGSGGSDEQADSSGAENPQ